MSVELKKKGGTRAESRRSKDDPGNADANAGAEAANSDTGNTAGGDVSSDVQGGSPAQSCSDYTGEMAQDRTRLLEALRLESSESNRALIIEAIKLQSEWEGRITEKGITLQADLERQTFEADLEELKATRKESVRHGIREILMLAIPGAIAVGVLAAMFFFLIWKMDTAAAIMREVLMILVIGTLGWVAGRSSGKRSV